MSPLLSFRPVSLFLSRDETVGPGHSDGLLQSVYLFYFFPQRFGTDQTLLYIYEIGCLYLIWPNFCSLLSMQLQQRWTEALMLSKVQ